MRQFRSAREAARCLRWTAVEHPRFPGRYQLQLAHGDKFDGVPVRGFDFELSAVEVLMACRDDLTPPDGDWEEEVTICPDLLAALAHPFMSRC